MSNSSSSNSLNMTGGRGSAMSSIGGGGGGGVSSAMSTIPRYAEIIDYRLLGHKNSHLASPNSPNFALGLKNYDIESQVLFSSTLIWSVPLKQNWHEIDNMWLLCCKLIILINNRGSNISETKYLTPLSSLFNTDNLLIKNQIGQVVKDYVKFHLILWRVSYPKLISCLCFPGLGNRRLHLLKKICWAIEKLQHWQGIKFINILHERFLYESLFKAKL